MEGRIVFAGLMPHAPILAPGVGGDNFAQVEATAQAMSLVASHALAAQPDTLVLISPHSPRHSGAFGLWYSPRLHGTLSRFGSPSTRVDLPLDRDFADRLELETKQGGLQTWRITHEQLDHGALVPLCYLAAAGWTGRTVILGLNYPGEGGLDQLGQAIVRTAQELGRRTAIIASGDMSHRLTQTAPAGYDPEAHRFDETFVGLLHEGAYGRIGRLDPPLQERAAEDVVDSTRVALAASGYQTTGHEVLSYEGPFGVGYGVAILFEPKMGGTEPSKAADTSDAVVARLADLPMVARCSVETRLRQGATDPLFGAGGEVAERGAVFVTVRGEAGELRGCRGVTVPVERNLVWQTWRCAVDAALFDTRFPAVTSAELPSLRFSVTVLGELEPVTSSAELNPAVYGVLVSAGDGRRGVLLPAIDGIDSVEQQVAIARQKAGIAAGEVVRLERFSARSFAEERAAPAGGNQPC